MNLVTLHDGRPVTTSRKIAAKFSKNHRDVVRAINQLDCSEEFGLRNFAHSSYLNAQGKTLKEYVLTRDGFVFLVMGFTGKAAAKFKEEYIAEFNRMEEAIRSPPQSLTPLDALAQTVQVLQNQERRLQVQEEKVKLIEAKLTTRDEEFYTISGYARLINRRVDKNTALKLGKQASKLSREQEYCTGKEKDSRYGYVKSYHLDILGQIF